VNTGGIPEGLPIASLAGDQQAALYGQACFEPGLIKATYGTGCFILMSTGSERVHPTQGLLATVAATPGGDGGRYAVEGSIYIAGAALQWCRDNLGLVASTEEAVALAASVPDSGGVVFVPAFVGLGSPYWDADVRGAIYGLTGATQPAHIVRAALDSMAFQAQDVLSVMTRESGLGIAELRVDGGAAANDALMQLQADLAGVPVSRPQSVESTALGAAFLAGLAVGFWRDEAEVQGLRREAALIVPSDRRAIAAAEYGRWRSAVSGLLGADIPPV
jgi:glycerol kinase